MKFSWLQRWLRQSLSVLQRVAAYFAVIVFALFLITTTEAAAASLDSSTIQVYRDPGCRCCGGWMEHVAAQGLQPENMPTTDMDALKQDYGVPDGFTSCHTAILDGYVIEGHVPIADIQRLVTEQPNIKGIAVPGMPIGTPGMESGEERESFTVYSFDEQGNTAVFNQYSF